MSYETEYTLAALVALEPWLFLLPTDVQRKIKLARSVVESHGYPSSAELKAELGENWVLARRTKSIVAKYGDNVRCYSHAQYEAAERRALEKRVP